MSQHAKDIFLSAVLDRPVISRSGREVGRLFDVAMSPGDPLPVVHHVLVKSARAMRRVAFDDLAMFNDVVVSLKGEPEALPDLPEAENEVLMRRDILDKQIVDVDGARVVRVNDLKLALASGGLCLSSVDVGFRGILRRLGYLNAWDFLGGVLKRKLPPKEIDWLLVQPLDANLTQLTLTVTRDKLSDMHPADLANILAQLPHKNVSAVLSSIDVEAAGEAMGEMEPEDSSRLLSQMDSSHAADVLEEMSPDEAADVLAELPDEKAQELLAQMDPEDAEKVQELLEHEDDSAGGLMNNEFLFVEPGHGGRRPAPGAPARRGDGLHLLHLCAGPGGAAAGRGEPQARAAGARSGPHCGHHEPQSQDRAGGLLAGGRAGACGAVQAGGCARA